MILSAKDALGRIPTLNADLLDIETNYFARGDIFRIAVDNNRVVGTIGTLTRSPNDIWLKRLYVKPSEKRRGIGRALVGEIEIFARERKAVRLHTRFAGTYSEAALFYPAIGFKDAGEDEVMRHMIKFI
jgi:GNAT superfamily N-acetyltransferase